MKNEELLKSIYNDFFGSSCLQENSEFNIKNDIQNTASQDNTEKITKIKEKIDELNIEDKSKDLLNKIII